VVKKKPDRNRYEEKNGHQVRTKGGQPVLDNCILLDSRDVTANVLVRGGFGGGGKGKGVKRMNEPKEFCSRPRKPLELFEWSSYPLGDPGGEEGGQRGGGEIN